MKIKGIKDEDYVNYKKPSMFIIFPKCTFKCDKENGCKLCQNASLAHDPTMDVPTHIILARYKSNPLTHAIVCGGLEPFDTPNALVGLIETARHPMQINDDIVIYTGYTEEEILSQFTDHYNKICQYPNIIIKFGRYVPHEAPHVDPVLGVKLASKNQYAKKVT